MPRILLFTGKGGVGKTSIAAATALRAAEQGTRTLVISTDAAHSLGDVFDRPIGPEPVRLVEGLDGQEVDIVYSVEKNFRRLQQYIHALFRWRGVDEILADEMSVLPGMEEVAAFLWVQRHFSQGHYELIIIDAAPTGETLRFLSLPDVGRWWMDRFFPIHRKVARVLRPAVQSLSSLPLPQEETYDAAAELFDQLDAIHTAFTDPETTSVRLVLTPEMVVIKESQRTFTYLHLFGYALDAVVLNRVLPKEVEGGYFSEMRRAQQANRRRIEQAFGPLPILEAPFYPGEVMGLPYLRRMGASLYAERPPGERIYRGAAFRIGPDPDGGICLALPLPLIRRDEVRLTQRGHEMIITIGSYRRSFHLPRALGGREIEQARLVAGELRVRFGPRRDRG